MHQNTHSVILYPLNEFQVISMNLTWRSPTMHNWNSSKLRGETHLEDYREKKSKGNKAITQNSLYETL